MPVSCSDHREAMLLLALKKRLAEGNLSPREQRDLEVEIRRLEERLKL
ncbi:MAG: hypothetical protein HY892_21135 [Deltaproteobacteria bacterium]|nr:hypothetical protein [Deltaproteobacteria bacterium]